MSNYISREAIGEFRLKNIEIINSRAYIELEELIAFVDGIPAADVEPAHRWIPCSERLPEQEGTYIVVTNKVKPVVTTARFYNARDQRDYKGDVFGHSDAHFQTNRYVTHWMPMPEPPKEGDTP